jgi:DNA modification methylase
MDINMGRMIKMGEEEGYWQYLIDNSYQSKEVDIRKVLDLPLSRAFGKYATYFTDYSRKHPAVMNVELAEWIILKFTQKGWNICDPMAGIGTVPIVASLNNRNSVAFDIEDQFVREIQNNYRNVEMTCLTQTGKVLSWQADVRKLKNVRPWPMHFDFLCFSPPYLPDRPGKTKTRYEEDAERGYTQGAGCFRYHYSNNPLNIGNARKYEEYKQLMLQVYLSCYSILDNYKNMVLVTKNGVRNGETVRLDTDTIKLCEDAGFTFIERYWFKVQTPSFFIMENARKWYAKYSGETIHPYSAYEDVLVFQK